MTRRLDMATRRSLRFSHRDAAASAVMSGVTDHYLHAYAIFLRATPSQIAWLTSLPSLFGAIMQLLSAWLAHKEFPRHRFVAAGAVVQASVLLALLTLPFINPVWAVPGLIGAVVVYRAAGNLTAPVWQSLMRDLVPERRRGRFFAHRTCLSTAVAFVALAGGGLFLDVGNWLGLPAAGFLILFGIAIGARYLSAWYLARMHEPGQPPAPAMLEDFHPRPLFLRFVLLNAGVQGAVAVAGPFFAIHMLRDLGFSYTQYMAVLAASVFVQFLTLNAWGGIADRFGNLRILHSTAWLIPLIPALWIFSGDFWWLLSIQLLSGVAWGGFTLAAGNYLYDLRGGKPLPTMLAINAIFTALAIFIGATLGSAAADWSSLQLAFAGITLDWSDTPLLGVFALSAALRLLVVLLFLRGLQELRNVPDSGLRDVIFRLARFNSITGVTYDLIGAVSRKNIPAKQAADPTGATGRFR